MRGRLQEFLPIALIALAVQILAPITGWRAAAVAASDLLQRVSIICHGAAGATSGPDDQTDGQADAGACIICCLAQANVSLDAPPTRSVPFDRDAARFGWRDTASAPIISRPGISAQARAPPGLL